MAILQNAINANSTTPLLPVQGGLGVSSPTVHGILVGEGASAVASKVLTNGQLLIGDTGSDPVAAVISSTGTTLTVTTGAGTLNIDLNPPVSTANGGSGVVSPTAHGILVAEGASAFNPIVLTNGQLLIGDTGADPVAATLTAGAGITITPAAGAITIASSSTMGGGFTWVDVTASTVTMAAGHAYVADDASGQLNATLPAVAAFGDSFRIVGGATVGQTGWSILQNAGQSIIWGNTQTTVGVGGSITSGNAFDELTFTCVVANTTFVAYGAQGSNLTVV